MGTCLFCKKIVINLRLLAYIFNITLNKGELIYMWQSFNVGEVARKLRTNIERGLSKEEAENRRNKHGPNKLEEKKKENILIRFGKMTSRYCLAKCNTNFDKQFARQEQELFTDMPRTINMHLGYTTSKKTGLINEIILAIPLSQKTNASIYLFSEKDQKEFPIQQNSVQKSGNGFKEKLLSDNNKTETEIK